MKKLLLYLLLVLLPVGSSSVFAQQYTGMTGLLHVPSAEMDTIETLRLGVHAIPTEMMPDEMRFEGEKYASSNWYISAMPLKWLEVGYSFTLMKFHRNLNKKSDDVGFYSKDRYFSVRLRPLSEGRYWPSVVIGGNDVIGQRDGDSYSFYFRNFYVALSKHYELYGNIIGAHVAYRHWKRDYNSKWNGPVGGLTFQPSFARELRLIGEYDGDGVNVGADYLLFRRVMVQAALHHGHYFNAGGCFYWDLDGMARKVKDKVKKKNESR